jgi:hypothetical protein
MQTDYDKQAADFMEKTGTTMETEFIGNMFHFEDDKEKRDVYQMTLERAGKRYYFRFGQSIANSGDKVKRNPRGKTMYDAELISRPGGRIVPTAYDILACVQKYDIGTFSDFCDEFGYHTDSRKAEKLYLAVQEEFDSIERLFGDVLEELQEIS